MLITLGGVGGAVAANTIGSSDINDNSIRSVDIRNGAIEKEDIGKDAVGASEIKNGSVFERALSDSVQEKLNQSAGERGPKGETGATGATGPAGANGSPASDVFGELAASKTSTSRTTINAIGGSFVANRTEVFTIDLPAKGTYLLSAYGHFDRIDKGASGYIDPTTDTYLRLTLQGPNGADDAGTYFTGPISRAGRVEATAAGSRVVTVTAPTTVTVWAFGYNEAQGFFGSASEGIPQFSVFAEASAVRIH